MDVRSLGRLPVLGAATRALAAFNGRHPWSHNDHFHGWVLGHLPERRGVALDVGCGQGALVEELAGRFDEVVGTDTDAGMRRAARARTAHLSHVRISSEQLADLEGPVDLVTMVAVLHHLDVPAALREVRRRAQAGAGRRAAGGAPAAAAGLPPHGRVDQPVVLAELSGEPLRRPSAVPAPGR